MAKKITIIVTTIILVWLIASFIDVDLHNLTTCHYQAWNFFVLFEKFALTIL